MTLWDQSVLLVIAEPSLKQQLLSELVLRRPLSGGAESDARRGGRGRYQVSLAGSLAEALPRLAGAGVRSHTIAVLDEPAIGAGGISQHGHASRLRELAEHMPLILVLNPERLDSMNGLAGLVAEGRLEIVPRPAGRSALCVPLVMALVERHARAKLAEIAPDEALWQNFGEILRHEVNNPLTGILGNAELMLARRDKLSPTTVERLKTIADLAVRLRETVRRLSNAWEDYAARPSEVEVSR